MKRWYALHTTPNAEHRVATLLEKREIETFIPEIPNTDRGSGAASRPLFPGYLFIRINLDQQLTAVWLRFPGVRYIVAHDNEPVSITDEIITRLRQRNARLAKEMTLRNSRFEQGGLVRIKDGPFKDMLAIFEREEGPKERVTVLLQALDRAFRLHLAASKLDVVDSHLERPIKKRPRRTRGRGRPIRS